LTSSRRHSDVARRRGGFAGRLRRKWKDHFEYSEVAVRAERSTGAWLLHRHFFGSGVPDDERYGAPHVTRPRCKSATVGGSSRAALVRNDTQSLFKHLHLYKFGVVFFLRGPLLVCFLLLKQTGRIRLWCALFFGWWFGRRPRRPTHQVTIPARFSLRGRCRGVGLPLGGGGYFSVFTFQPPDGPVSL
jgi:hypothetical protein